MEPEVVGGKEIPPLQEVVVALEEPQEVTETLVTAVTTQGAMEPQAVFMVEEALEVYTVTHQQPGALAVLERFVLFIPVTLARSHQLARVTYEPLY